jgi:hypothetical protein
MSTISTSVTVCIDDTDRPRARGTDKLALSILDTLDPRYRCRSLTLHPHGGLLPGTTSRSCCMRFEDHPELDLDELVHEVRCLMLEDLVEGSAPALCAGRHIPLAAMAFARRSRHERLDPAEAFAIAAAGGLILEALTSQERGVVGALAGAGMAAAGGPGSYLQLGSTPLEHSGLISHRKLARVGIERFLDVHTGEPVEPRPLWVPDKLRPSMIDGLPTLLVETTESGTLAFAEQDV